MSIVRDFERAFNRQDVKGLAYRECFDMGAALLPLGFSPEAMAKTIRRHRL